MTATCSSCSAPIRWALTTNGQRMPVDMIPTPDGNLSMIEGPAGAVVRVLRKGEAHEGPRYRSHFSSCPQAAQHRRA